MERQFRKMLKMTPAQPKAAIIVTIIFMLIAYSIILSFYRKGDGQYAVGWLGVIIITLPLFGLFMYFQWSKLRNARQNGRRSLKLLESSGMLDKAVQEYFGVEGIRCKITHTNGVGDKFVSRDNALTPNFVFAMSDNIIVPWSNVVSVGIMRCVSSEVEHRHIQHIVYADTADDCRVDIHGINGDTITAEQQKQIDMIFDYVERVAPGCTVDRSVKQNEEY